MKMAPEANSRSNKPQPVSSNFRHLNQKRLQAGIGLRFNNSTANKHRNEAIREAEEEDNEIREDKEESEEDCSDEENESNDIESEDPEDSR